MNSRYVIGIDLGTTNCALARRDASAPDEHRPVEVQPIAQLVNPGEVAERSLLPSFLYIPGDMDFPEGTTTLPWEPRPQYIVGELARNRGSENATRVIASANGFKRSRCALNSRSIR